jgi:hypothetical protein
MYRSAPYKMQQYRQQTYAPSHLFVQGDGQAESVNGFHVGRVTFIEVVLC